MIDVTYHRVVCDIGLLQEGNMIHLHELASQLASLVVSHGYLERRHNTIEDDGLIGLLTLAAAVIRHNPPFKSSSSGQVCSSVLCEFFAAILVINFETVIEVYLWLSV